MQCWCLRRYWTSLVSDGMVVVYALLFSTPRAQEKAAPNTNMRVTQRVRAGVLAKEGEKIRRCIWHTPTAWLYPKLCRNSCDYAWWLWYGMRRNLEWWVFMRKYMVIWLWRNWGANFDSHRLLGHAVRFCSADLKFRKLWIYWTNRQFA